MSRRMPARDSAQFSLGFGADTQSAASAAPEPRRQEHDSASRLVGPPEVFRHPIAALETTSADQTVNWTISNKRYTYTCRQKPSSHGYATLYDLEVFLVALTGLYRRNLSGDTAAMDAQVGPDDDLPSEVPCGQSSITMDLSAFLALLAKTPTRQTVHELSCSLARLRGTLIEYVKTNNATKRAERTYIGGWVNEAIIDEDPLTGRRTITINFSQWTMQALEEDRLFFIDQRLLNIRKPVVRRIAMMLASRSLQIDRAYTPESVCSMVFPGLALARAKHRLKTVAEDGPIWGHALEYDGSHFRFSSQTTSVIDALAINESHVLEDVAADVDSASVPAEGPKKKVKRLPKASADVDPFTAAALGFMPKPPVRARKPRTTRRASA